MEAHKVQEGTIWYFLGISRNEPPGVPWMTRRSSSKLIEFNLLKGGGFSNMSKWRYAVLKHGCQSESKCLETEPQFHKFHQLVNFQRHVSNERKSRGNRPRNSETCSNDEDNI
ncbi:hypothetical protein TNCV_2276681 [Trichonephila clavipes]|nr:hypothetical protein TNCV_2276681 [Trichonephila clavipes]